MPSNDNCINIINTPPVITCMETIEETVEETVQETGEETGKETIEDISILSMEIQEGSVPANGVKCGEGRGFSGERRHIHNDTPRKKRSQSISYWEQEIAEERKYNNSVRRAAMFFSVERRDMHSNAPLKKRKQSILHWEQEIDEERKYNVSIRHSAMLGRKRDYWVMWSSSSSGRVSSSNGLFVSGMGWV
jgi:hypothetical protein